MGLHYTRSQVRRKFWIPKDTFLLKKILRNCKVCYAQRGKRYHIPDSPSLPEYRFDVAHPFRYTHLDMTGCYYVKDKHGNAEKIYFIIFICPATGAGHIEYVMDASAEAFANAFDRFCSKNGVPEHIVSDHGSNFKAYFAELKKISDDIVRNRFFEDKGISWTWTPIGDPHFNGLCERSVSIIKAMIKKAVKNKLLTFDQLVTVATYAQALFNERPLSVLEGSDPEFIPVTPNSLVLGRNLRLFAHGVNDSKQSDPDFSPSPKSYEIMHKKLRS